MMGEPGLKEAGGIYMYAALMTLLQLGRRGRRDPTNVMDGIPPDTTKILFYSDGASKHFKVIKLWLFPWHPLTAHCVRLRAGMDCVVRIRPIPEAQRYQGRMQLLRPVPRQITV